MFLLRSQKLWTVLVILAIGSRVTHSLHFDLHSGRTKCIAEDIKSNSMTVGKYSVDNPHDGHDLPQSHKISVKVTQIPLILSFLHLFFWEI